MKIQRSGNALVVKAGGALLSTPEKILHMAYKIYKLKEKYDAVFFAVSAMGKETDELLALIKKIDALNPDPREVDQLIHLGEDKTAPLMALALRQLGIKAKSYTAATLGLIVKGNYGEAKYVGLKDPAKIADFARDHIMVIAGFQGICEKTGDFKTTGRGGSDASAVAFAAMMKPHFQKIDCVIFKEVDGIYAVDPNIIPNALRYDQVGYGDMEKFAEAGAGVLMDRSVQIAEAHDIVLKVVLSPTIGESDGGTTIKRIKGDPLNVEKRIKLRGIAVTRKVSIIKIVGIPNQPGSARKIFNRIETNIKEVNQEKHRDIASITVIIKDDDFPRIFGELHSSPLPKSIKIVPTQGLAEITIIDPDMEDKPRYFDGIASAISKVSVNMEVIGTYKKTITILIRDDKEEIRKVLTILAKKLELTTKS